MIKDYITKLIEYIFLNPLESIPPNLLQVTRDIPEYEYRLHLQVNKEQNNSISYTRDSFEDWNMNRMISNTYYYIAIENNKLLGSISFFKNPQECNTYYNIEPKHSLHISQFYINKEYRNRGIGTLLLLKVERYAKAHNYKLLDLKTSYTNTIAQSLYTKFNFKIKYISLLRKVSSSNRYSKSNNILTLVSNIDEKLDNYITNSIKRMLLYNNNGFSINQIKSYIINKITKDKSYKILKYSNDDIYVIYTILKKKNSLKILDIVGKDEYTIDNVLEYIIDSIYKFCIDNNINNIEKIERIDNEDRYMNLNFIGKMLSLIKII